MKTLRESVGDLAESLRRGTMDEQYIGEPQARAIADLKTENAGLQARVDVLEQEREEHRQHAQGYKALAERRGEALKELVGNINLVTTQGGNLYVLYVAHRERAEASLGQAHIAIDATPEQAREKEGKAI